MNALEIVDKHEFYQNNQLVEKPSETWQTLFAVIYGDGFGLIKKDCLYYRIPGNSLGIVKIKSMNKNEKCDDFIFEESLDKTENVKSLQFSIEDDSLSVTISFNGYKVEKWEIPFLNSKKIRKPELGTSSADLKSGPIIYLASETVAKTSTTQTFLKNETLCHAISDECQETSPSNCGDCEAGWYEVPNGCPQGPKYCGIQECGQKHQPACRRGMEWQRAKKDFDCRLDNSFAYCSKGHNVQCKVLLPVVFNILFGREQY